MSVSLVPAKSSGGLQPYEQIFTSSGTWTKPAGVKTAEVTVVGASGGSSSGNPPSSAGGYFKRIIDVSNMSTVSVTVGAGGGSGATGGSSSFGTITCPGSTNNVYNTAGSWYDTSKSGVAYWQNSGSSYTGMYDIWYGSNGSVTYAKTANDGRVFVYGQGNGYNATSINGVGWSQMSGANAYGEGKIVYGNGVYVRVDGNNWANNIYYSTNGASWNYLSVPGGYYKYGLTYGPAGFLIASNDGTVIKSTDGTNWTQMANFPTSGAAFLESTSTHYYLFVSGNSTAWRSTDGNTWTSFSLPSSVNGNNYYYYSKNNKVYYIYSGTLYEIVDTTVTNKGSGFGNFTNAGSPLIYLQSGAGYQMVTNIGSTITSANLGGYQPAAASSNGWIVAQSNGWSYYFTGTYSGFDGQAGATYTQTGWTQTGTPGVTGTGTPSAGSYGAAYGIPGPGDVDGWGQGANYYSMAKTPGSGVRSTDTNTGNPGIVRVRWWA